MCRVTLLVSGVSAFRTRVCDSSAPSWQVPYFSIVLREGKGHAAVTVLPKGQAGSLWQVIQGSRLFPSSCSTVHRAVPEVSP